MSKNRSALRSWFTVDQTVQVAISGDSRTRVPARLIALCSSAVRLELARPLAEGTDVTIAWNLVSMEGIVVECGPAQESYRARIYLKHVDFSTTCTREHWTNLMEEEPVAHTQKARA